MTAFGDKPKFQSARCEGEFKFQSGPLVPWVRFLPDSFGCTLSNGRGLDGFATGSFDPEQTYSCQCFAAGQRPSPHWTERIL